MTLGESGWLPKFLREQIVTFCAMTSLRGQNFARGLYEDT